MGAKTKKCFTFENGRAWKRPTNRLLESRNRNDGVNVDRRSLDSSSKVQNSISNDECINDNTVHRTDTLKTGHDNNQQIEREIEYIEETRWRNMFRNRTGGWRREWDSRFFFYVHIFEVIAFIYKISATFKLLLFLDAKHKWKLC